MIFPLSFPSSPRGRPSEWVSTWSMRRAPRCGLILEGKEKGGEEEERGGEREGRGGGDEKEKREIK